MGSPKSLEKDTFSPDGSPLSTTASPFGFSKEITPLVFVPVTNVPGLISGLPFLRHVTAIPTPINLSSVAVLKVIEFGDVVDITADLVVPELTLASSLYVPIPVVYPSVSKSKENDAVALILNLYSAVLTGT